MSENVLENIIKKKIENIDNLKKSIDLKKLDELIQKNKSYINFKEKIDEKHLNLNEIKKKIENQIDIIGRNDSFTKVVLNENFPEYLLNNKEFYEDWLI